MPDALHPWTRTVRLHPDVEAGGTAVATYAIDLGALVAGDPNVPLVYREARAFFAATYLTHELRRLLADVLGGLAGRGGDHVLQLRAAFGGGKSHTLAALYHAAGDRRVLDEVPDAGGLPDPGPVRVAVFDGEKFDVQGRQIAGQPVYTMWGLLAAQLGEYDKVAYHDEHRIAPAGDVIAALLGEQPTLILLDEVLKYIESAGARPVGDSTLGRQTQSFLQSLSVEVARVPRAMLVYSLQASSREALGNDALLDMLNHLTSRVDAKREPVPGDEILPVVRRRLLAEVGPDAAARAAEVYAKAITQMRVAQASDAASQRMAQDDQIALRARLAAAYPFHPALIDLMSERWGSLPDFQRTRGALRFLAVCLHTLKQTGQAGYLLGPGDIPITDKDVAQAFFTEVGQREPFASALAADFTGPNARVRRIDEQLAAQYPHLSTVHPAMRIATAILAHSFGGPPRPGDPGGDPTNSGVTEAELLAAVIQPDLDSLTVQAVLTQLREQCLYLHYDGARYVVKTTPNITHTIEEQAGAVGADEIERALRDELNSRLSGRAGARLWPQGSQEIADGEPRFLLAYLPLDFARDGDAQQEERARALLATYGDRPRQYRNGLGLAVPDRSQVDASRRAMRYKIAVGLVTRKRQALNLTASQVQQLKDREQSETNALEVALRALYPAVWLPRADGGAIGLEKVSLSTRPMQATGTYERLIELLVSVAPPRLFRSITPEKMAELMRLGDNTAGPRQLAVADIVATFYSVLGFPRLESADVLRRAIAEGVQRGLFGYVGAGAAQAGVLHEESGSYLVDASHARIGVNLPEVDVDLSGAFVVLPDAIKPAAPPPPAAEPPAIGTPHLASSPLSTTTDTAASYVAVQPPPSPAAVKATPSTTIRLRLRMTRGQVYAGVNALSNLAQVAGSIDLTVEAQKPDGFDPTWLRNAVLEPLDEADMLVDEGG